MGGAHHKGGHELEGLDAPRISLIVAGLMVIVGLASVAVAQWFFNQRDELIIQRTQESDWSLLDKQHAEEEEKLKGVDTAARKLIDNPENLGGTVPPTGWIHPDDVKKGGGAAPSPETEGM